MEVKINKEIREYKETMFFGLSLRQFVFSLLAVAAAVLFYFLLKPYFGMETVSWMCIIGALPFAVMGFFSYHGMTAEEFLINWFRTEILEPKVLFYEPENYLYDAVKDTIKRKEKEEYKGENSKKNTKRR